MDALRDLESTKISRVSTLSLKPPSLMMWVWRRFTKDQSVKVKVKVIGHFLPSIGTSLPAVDVDIFYTSKILFCHFSDHREITNNTKKTAAQAAGADPS